MCAFWKKWFNKSETEELRDLAHPKDLKVKDVVQFDDSFSLPEDIRGKAYTVVGVNTYQYEHSQDTAWTLKSAENNILFMCIAEEDGESELALSLKLTREHVESWFEPDDFARIFNEDAELELTPLRTEEGFVTWVEGTYHLTSNVQRGFYYAEDLRGRRASTFEGDGEPFDYYCLENKSETHALEIEVFQDGTTEVNLTKYQPMSAIKEMWPAK